MKRVFSIVVLLAVVCFGISAETIFVSVLERTPDNSLYNFEASSAWEEGVLDALFDFGSIVSNTPLQSASAFVKEEALKTAQEGGADSVVVVELTYPVIPDVKNKTRVVPSIIRFSLYSTESGTMLRQLQYTPPASARNMEDDKKQAIEQTLRLFAGL